MSELELELDDDPAGAVVALAGRAGDGWDAAKSGALELDVDGAGSVYVGVGELSWAVSR